MPVVPRTIKECICTLHALRQLEVAARFVCLGVQVKTSALQCRCWRPLAAGAMQRATCC